ncbi:type VII secretion target [Streptomyces sp. NPDC004647]|uniref:type VII secretion target n=1 Tax=Streptomyces sp. NPDC004647 TaxID=3154671 RepID=UPI0033BAB370
MDFDVEHKDLDAFAEQIRRAAEDLEQAKRYCAEHSNIAVSNEGLISMCLTTHTATVQQVTNALKKTQEIVRSSGREMAASAKYYRETDEANAAKVDATYPATKR